MRAYSVDILTINANHPRPNKRATMSIHQPTIRAHEEAQRRAILRWAEVAASENHESEIVIPPGFDRQQALDALEIAVCRKYQFIGALELSQGRTSADTRFAGASLMLTLALGVAIGLAALVVLMWWAI